MTYKINHDSTSWYRCQYEIREIPSGLDNKTSIKIIAPVQGSESTSYNLLDSFDKAEWQEGDGKQNYQPTKLKGKEWPPHLALARLDLANEEDICEFCSDYGLLGLRHIPEWREKEPNSAITKLFDPRPKTEKEKLEHFSKPRYGDLLFSYWQDEAIYSRWYDVSDVAHQNTRLFYVYKECEPLEIFKAAAKSYQELIKHVFRANKKFNDKATEDLEGSVSFSSIDAVGGYHILAIRSTKGDWTLGWRIRSLLEACQILLVMDLTKGHDFQACKRERCKQIFLAKNRGDKYCCVRCRKADTSFHTPVRELKRFVRDKSEKGEISSNQKKELYIFIEDTWKNHRPEIGWTKQKLSFEKFRELVDKRIAEYTLNKE